MLYKPNYGKSNILILIHNNSKNDTDFTIFFPSIDDKLLHEKMK